MYQPSKEYHLICLKTDEVVPVTVISGGIHLNDFIRNAFCKLAGTDVDLEDVYASDAVRRSLNGEFGTDKLVIKRPEYHISYGDCFICEERWKSGRSEGYYTFDKTGALFKCCDFCEKEQKKKILKKDDPHFVEKFCFARQQV